MLSQASKSNTQGLCPTQKDLIAVAVGLCLYGATTISSQAEAALPDGTQLTMTLGDGSCAAGGTWPNCEYGANVVTSGSFFTMDGNFGAVVESDLGIVLGTTQPFDGNVPSSGNPYDGSGTNITEPWPFFSNIGTNFSASAITAISDTAIDMSGWRVAWGEVAEIDMGDGADATMVCAGGTCENGDTYTLDYETIVPPGDPSGFGGVAYTVHLEGTVIFSGAPPNTLPDQANTITGNSVTIEVLNNDDSADGLDPTSVTVVAPGPTDGSATPNPDGTVTYTPDTVPPFTGQDSFDYTVDSSLGVTSAATLVDVDVQTNVAPVAGNDALNTNTDTLNNAGGSLTVPVLDNDTDANNGPDLPGGIDTTAVTILSQPAIGTCTANTDGTITYSQPLPAVVETDNCTYEDRDIDSFGTPLTSNTASLDISVTALTSDWPAVLDPDIIPVLLFEDGVPGDPVDSSIPAQSGTYFTMQVTPTTLIYTVMEQASSGGIVIGHDQPAGNSHTGAPTGDEETVIDLGWSFFANTGFTFAKNGGIVGNSDGTLQFGGDPAVNGGQGRYLITWNGVPEIDLGGDPTGTFPDDLGFATIACTPAPCEDQSTFELDYAAHVPPGDASGFGGVPYTLKMVGTVGFLDGTLKTSTGTVTSETRILADDMTTSDPDPDVELQCVGDCFGYTIDGLTANKASIVIPLAGGVPINPVWRILENDTWRNFDTTVDIIKSAPFAPGQKECPDPGDATYAVPPTTGDYCIELTIQDNGLNDLNPAIGTISDPSGMGSGGSAGGGIVFEDTRTSNTSESWGCSLMTNKVAPLQRSDWWLLAGLIGLLGWRHRRHQH